MIIWRKVILSDRLNRTIIGLKVSVSSPPIDSHSRLNRTIIGLKDFTKATHNN